MQAPTTRWATWLGITVPTEHGGLGGARTCSKPFIGSTTVSENPRDLATAFTRLRAASWPA